MALTERQLSRAYEMASEGLDSKTIARKMRITTTSAAAVKANWTRSQNAASTTKVAKSAKSTNNTGPVVVRVNSQRLRDAIASGRQVQLVLELQ